MSTLDGLKTITLRDKSDALGLAEKQFSQLALNFDIKPSKDIQINKVIVVGMGESALAAKIAIVWPSLNVPFEIVRDYSLPNWADKQTLVVVSSYSGNAEEPLSCLTEAQAKNSQIVIIASGGKLAEAAKTNNYLMAKLPVGVQPRMSTFAQLKALVSIFVAYKLAAASAVNKLEELAEKSKSVTANWRADVPTSKNQAKQIAEHLVGKTPIIYGGPKTYPAAYKWKASFNLNAKNTAWCNQYPEYDHNELLGWTSHPIEKPFAPVNLISSFEHPRILKRFEISDRLLSGKRPAPLNITAKGDSLIEQILWLIALGDMTSLYLAILNNVDPTPTNLIEKLKNQL